MKSGRLRFTLAAALTFAVAAPAAAQDAQVRLEDVGESVTGTYNETGQVYVGHYGLRFLDPSGSPDYPGAPYSATPGFPYFDAWCVDFQHRVSLGNTWDVNLTQLNEDLSQTRLGESAASRASYQKAAWLTTQFADALHSEWDAIHAAIWQITGIAGVPSGSGATGVGGWLANAEANYASVDLTRFAVITPTNFPERSSRQEFLMAVPGTVTPEPVSIILLASGLLGLGFAALRRRDDEDVEDSDTVA